MATALILALAQFEEETGSWGNSYFLQKMAEYEDIAILTFVNLLHEQKSDRLSSVS